MISTITKLKQIFPSQSDSKNAMIACWVVIFQDYKFNVSYTERADKYNIMKNYQTQRMTKKLDAWGRKKKINKDVST